jgi:phosphate:Na+ symporter
MLFQLLGGIGLFLMGMILLTDGLKAFAGEALRKTLIRFTGSPLKALGSGALLTAVVQSSSATTVTVIGFVSAGLLTFSQSVGVVIGASLGTTTTGWVVAVLGLKVSIGYYALPLVGVGAFLRLLARGRWKSFGWSVAGFGFIFIGIETLQTGMTGLAGYINVANLPQTGLISHFLAMVIGIVMTIVMQSSSAAVATTLTALHTGTINFEQSASLLIGSAIGTTVTGAIAAIGGSVSAKRTALAHVTFNLATGLIAILLLPLLLWVIRLAQFHLSLDPGAVSLAAFHTVFILVGVVIFFPFLDRFARTIERWLPEVEMGALRHLDNTVLNMPAVALEVTRRALSEVGCEVFRCLAQLSQTHSAIGQSELTKLEMSIDRIQTFFASIPTDGGESPISELRVSQVHSLEHLNRLLGRLSPTEATKKMLSHDRLKEGLGLCQEILRLGESGLIANANDEWLVKMEQAVARLGEIRDQERRGILKEVARGERELALTLQVIDALRWLERVGYHSWRVSYYLAPPNNGH